MRKLLLSLSAAALAALSASPAAASSADGGYVIGFATLGSNIVLVFTDGTRTTPPSCSNTNFPNRWAINVSTSDGQAAMSLLLTARALHETVRFYGTGTCSVLGDSETIGAVVTNNLM